MTRPRIRVLAALAAVVGLLCAPGSTPALTVLPLDLPALASGAADIFVARVEATATGNDAHGLPAVWTTFVVAERLKGAPASRVTLKQLGARFGAGEVVPHGALPRYRTGETVLLFVHGPSPLGFTSPVGLAQGCFRVRERDGAPVAENDVGNRNLAAPPAAARARTAAAAPETAAVPLDALLGRVRALVAAAP